METGGWGAKTRSTWVGWGWFFERRQSTAERNHCLTLPWLPRKTIRLSSPHLSQFQFYLSRKEKTFSTPNSLEMLPTTLSAALSSFSISPSSISRCFLVSRNSFGNPISQMLQNKQIAPNITNPSHQFPTHRVSCIVNEVWTPSSTNIERKLESNTKPTAAPEIKWKEYTRTQQKIKPL